MDINAGIVDQQVSGILEKYPDLPPHSPQGADPSRRRSVAFVVLCMAHCLNVSVPEAAELLTDGGNDCGIDGLHSGDVEDGEFPVTIFQGKYKDNLEGTFNFPENSVQKVVNTVRLLFDPAKTMEMNPTLRPRIEEIRSLVRDGYIPNVRVILCNNGAKWTDQGQHWIDQAGIPENQVTWIHFNHDSLMRILRKTTAINDSLQMTGNAVVENFNFRRVVLGKVQVTEIARLFNRYQDQLLQRNIRRYLGLNENRVNAEIRRTLLDQEQRENFYFFNNGITLICTGFRYNALQAGDYLLKLENMQVINGGQTCKVIQQAVNAAADQDEYRTTYVMVRIYELAEDDRQFVSDITCATNSQNPVDLRDLRSNDDLQKNLEIGIRELSYTYKRQRDADSAGPAVLTSALTAEAVLAVWRKKPHQAKFRRKEHFGKLYEEIFRDLNAAQAVLAVLLFRMADQERRRPTRADAPEWLSYASHYLAMIVGARLLRSMGLTSVDGLSHRNFKEAVQQLERHRDTDYRAAVEKISETLRIFYGRRPLSLQQLAATFRRGDLIEMLAAPVLPDYP